MTSQKLEAALENELTLLSLDSESGWVFLLGDIILKIYPLNQHVERTSYTVMYEGKPITKTCIFRDEMIREATVQNELYYKTLPHPVCPRIWCAVIMSREVLSQKLKHEMIHILKEQSEYFGIIAMNVAEGRLMLDISELANPDDSTVLKQNVFIMAQLLRMFDVGWCYIDVKPDNIFISDSVMFIDFGFISRAPRHLTPIDKVNYILSKQTQREYLKVLKKSIIIENLPAIVQQCEEWGINKGRVEPLYTTPLFSRLEEDVKRKKIQEKKKEQERIEQEQKEQEQEQERKRKADFIDSIPRDKVPKPVHRLLELSMDPSRFFLRGSIGGRKTKIKRKRSLRKRH